MHADVLLPPVGGVEDDMLWPWDGGHDASIVVTGPQTSPNNPEMALCNVSVESSMAACLIYELPDSLLKLIYDGRLPAMAKRVAIPCDCLKADYYC
jgi:hypothetical protein